MPTSAEALRALQLQEVRWQAILDTAWDAIIGIDPLRQFKKFAREQRLQLRDLDLPAFLREIVAAWEQEASERGIASKSRWATSCRPFMPTTSSGA